MAYNNFTPQFYPPLSGMQPQYTQIPNQQSSNQMSNFIWVQGENSAKAYPVQPGKSAILMDSENPVFYIKSTDVNGMPLPLRIFDYTERIQNGNQSQQKTEESVYITKDEFEKLKEELRNEIRKIRRRPEDSVKENRNV